MRREPTIEPETPSTPPSAPPLRALVVDDSEPNRRLAEVLLRRHGLQVASAADGATALALLDGEPFDLVLLDAMMPGMDGPAVAREVRRREATAGLEPIPIVALTASFLPEDRARMREAGMDDHLAKPLRAEDLAEVLERRLPAGTRPRTVRIGTPATPSELISAGLPILDEVAFGRLVDLGDARLVERVVLVLLEDAAERVAEVDEAVMDRNAARLRVALDALEGIGATIGAPALGERTQSLRDALRRGPDAVGPSGLGPLLDATLAQIVDRLRAKPSSS